MDQEVGRSVYLRVCLHAHASSIALHEELVGSLYPRDHICLCRLDTWQVYITMSG